MGNFKKNYRETVFGLGLISLIFRFGEIFHYFFEGGKYGIFVGMVVVGLALYWLDNKKD